MKAAPLAGRCDPNGQSGFESFPASRESPLRKDARKIKGDEVDMKRSKGKDRKKGAATKLAGGAREAREWTLSVPCTCLQMAFEEARTELGNYSRKELGAVDVEEGPNLGEGKEIQWVPSCSRAGAGWADRTQWISAKNAWTKGGKEEGNGLGDSR
ncbi:hypothetical protein B0H19DRAFT_1235758 [Mycena capillaripes]|nr:hypothetical protein B0H19DRAFT_1235758 [Mycena capillaripes]